MEASVRTESYVNAAICGKWYVKRMNVPNTRRVDTAPTFEYRLSHLTNCEED